jgi:hypothetical protein
MLACVRSSGVEWMDGWMVEVVGVAASVEC